VLQLDEPPGQARLALSGVVFVQFAVLPGLNRENPSGREMTAA
jgi:hypothetical protein